MKVRFKTLSAGPKGVIRVGDIVDVSESEAALLVKVGCAEYLAPPAVLKPAPVPAPEPEEPKESPKPRKKKE